MKRIQHTTAASSMPALTGETGTTGFYQASSVGLGIPGTVVTQQWCNRIQEEICYPITQAGITLDGNDNTQLYQSINYLIGQQANRNLLINGEMQVWQRGDIGFSGVFGGQYTADRWRHTSSDANTLFYYAHNTTDLPPASLMHYNFPHVMEIGVNSTGTVSASSNYGFSQRVEGGHCRSWITGDVLTLSFCAYSSRGGTYGAYIQSSTADYSLVQNFTLPANTWTRVDLHFTKPASGTWLYTMGNIGLRCGITLQTGTAFQTASTSLSGQYFAQTGISNNLVAGDIFRFTGMMLVPGNNNLPFLNRETNETFRLCERYYQTSSGFFEPITTYSVATPLTPWTGVSNLAQYAIQAEETVNPNINSTSLLSIRPMASVPTVNIYSPFTYNQGYVAFAPAGDETFSPVDYPVNTIQGMTSSRFGRVNMSSTPQYNGSSFASQYRYFFCYTLSAEL